MTNKILFLDIDGVLNTVSWHKERYKLMKRNKDKTKKSKLDFDLEDLDPKLCDRLTDIINTTECDVCLLSSWKFLDGWKTALTYRGIPNVENWYVSHTYKFCDYEYRGLEVIKFLYVYKQYTNYCILDDESGYFDRQLNHHVKPNYFRGGLTNKLKEKCIEILNDTK